MDNQKKIGELKAQLAALKEQRDQVTVAIPRIEGAITILMEQENEKKEDKPKKEGK